MGFREKRLFNQAWSARKLIQSHHQRLFHSDDGYDVIVDSCLELSQADYDRHFMLYLLRSSDHFARELMENNSKIGVQLKAIVKTLHKLL